MNTSIELAWQLLPLQILNTLYMVSVSTVLAIVIGLPLGVILTITAKGHIQQNIPLHKLLQLGVNIGRSIPFAILMVALIPFTRWVVGTSLGTTASIIPLTLAAIPFIAKLIETHLKQVDPCVIEAAKVMGSKSWDIITKVLIQEALPAILTSITLTAVNLIGYSAMVGLVGGGGLGQVAIQYGYNRFNSFIMVLTISLLIVLVQTVQWMGTRVVQSILKKREQLNHD